MVREISVDPDSRLADSEIELSENDLIETETVRYGGRYELLSLVGAGAYGSVYRARDIELEEIVAIKILRPEQLAQPNAFSRFRNEVRLARRVSHPNVARTYDIGRHEGELFLTMEFIEGQPLTALGPVGVPSSALLPQSVVCEIGARLCAGLGALHEAGIVHQETNHRREPRRSVSLAGSQPQ
ncbi:MAG: protein kinase [Myxococcales bacterium]|nr:protein kinase [Myxococcales bacterium]